MNTGNLTITNPCTSYLCLSMMFNLLQLLIKVKHVLFDFFRTFCKILMILVWAFTFVAMLDLFVNNL